MASKLSSISNKHCLKCIFNNNKKTCSPVKKIKEKNRRHITILQADPPFVFFLIEEKRRLCLNHVKPLKSPQPELLD